MLRLPSIIATGTGIQIRRQWQYVLIVTLVLLLRLSVQAEAAAQSIPLRYGQAISAAKLARQSVPARPPAGGAR